MSWQTALARSRQLSARQWRAVLLALLYLPLVGLSLRLSGLMPTLRRFRPDGLAATGAAGQSQTSTESVALGRLVESVAGKLPWESGCLPLSVTQWIVLGKLGVACDLRIGVDAQHQGLAAHAWVQIGEVWLGSRLHEGRYARIWSSLGDGFDF